MFKVFLCTCTCWLSVDFNIGDVVLQKHDVIINHSDSSVVTIGYWNRANKGPEKVSHDQIGSLKWMVTYGGLLTKGGNDKVAIISHMPSLVETLPWHRMLHGENAAEKSGSSQIATCDVNWWMGRAGWQKKERIKSSYCSSQNKMRWSVIIYQVCNASSGTARSESDWLCNASPDCDRTPFPRKSWRNHLEILH